MAGTEEGTGMTTSVPTTSHEITVPTNQPATAPAAVPDFDTILPEKFKSDEYKGWLDPIRNAENPNKLEVLVEQAWSAQKKIGEKGLKVPDDASTPEDWKAFNKAIGVPDTAEEYKFEPAAWDEADKELGEVMVNSRSPEYMAKVSKMFHDAGVPPKTAQKLINSFDKLTLGEHREMIAQLKENGDAADQDFTTRAQKWYGANMDSVMKAGNDLVKAAMADPKTPEDAKAIFTNLGNDFILALAPVLDYVSRTYIQEDTGGARSALGSAGAGSQMPVTEAELRAEGMRLQATPEYQSGDPAAKAKVDAIYAKVVEVRNAGRKK